MAVPKKKTSVSRQGMRRSHDFITVPNVLVCTNCGSPILAHNICKFCNHYNGKQVFAKKQKSVEEKAE